MLEMKQLDQSIFLLESSKYNAIKVEFCNPTGNFSIIENNATAETLIEKYGSILQFFENLYAKGIKKLRITDRKANGSAFKSCGEYIVNFTAKDGEITSEPIAETQPVPEVQPYQAPTQSFGMAGMPQGLGMVEIHRIQDYDRVLAEKQKLEIEVAALKVSNQALRDENLRNEILGTKSVEKTDSNTALIDKFTPVALALIEKFQRAPVVAAVGLTGAENFTPLQNAFLQIIQNSDTGVLSDLMAVAQGINNPEFDTEMTELLKKYNLIQ
jgi:hypothetical protein